MTILWRWDRIEKTIEDRVRKSRTDGGEERRAPVVIHNRENQSVYNPFQITCTLLYKLLFVIS